MLRYKLDISLVLWGMMRHRPYWIRHDRFVRLELVGKSGRPVFFSQFFSQKCDAEDDAMIVELA